MATREAQFVQVVPLVLLHCPSASEPSTLASLLQVSSQCRTAVQQSQGHLSTLGRPLQHKLKSPAKLTSFIQWVPAHAGLVKHLGLPEPTGTAFKGMTEAAATFMLQLCSSPRVMSTTQPPPATTAAAAGAGGIAAPQATTRLPLRLTTFHTAWLHTPAVLEALAATEVQEMQLKGISSSALTPNFAAALGWLHSLQVLLIRVQHGVAGLPDVVAAAIGRLPHLRHLVCSVNAEQAVQLPGSLHNLSLHVYGPVGDAPTGLFVLTHLRQLHTLSVTGTPASPCRLHLGPALTSLSVQGGVDCVTGGSGLDKVCFKPVMLGDGHNPGRFLDNLRQLRTPWELEIDFAYVWSLSAEHLQPLVACVGQCTGLTRLRVAAFGVRVAGDVAWCSMIAQLPQLKALELWCNQLQPDDALHLSRLTGLTQLNLKVHKGLGDGACVAIAMCLTGLVDLSIACCEVMTPAILPVLAGGTTGLTRLHLGWHEDVLLSDGLVLQLARLQRLCWLTFDGAKRCSAAAQQQLLSAVPSLTLLHFGADC